MKKILACIMVMAMCFAFTACGGGTTGNGDTAGTAGSADTTGTAGVDNTQTEEKKYDASDESGIINCNLEEGFNQDKGNLSKDSSRLSLSAYSKNSGFVYLDVIVKHQNIKDFTLDSETGTASSYIYAEDLTTEETELFGLKGNKITFVDGGEGKNGKKQMYYVLIHGNAGEKGDVVTVHIQYFDEDLEQINKQLEQIELNWDAYDFDQESAS